MYQRKCSICMELFEARKDYEKICYGCYHKNRVQNHKEEKLKFLSEISYLRIRVNQLTEFFNPNMLRDIVFLCHPDRNANSERSRKVSAWLNNLREKINEE